MIEVIDVRGYQRRIHRKMYKSICKCVDTKDIITAPVVDKLIPKSRFGISVWSYLLVQKYYYHRPQHNTLKLLSHHGLSLSAGTITAGYRVLMLRYLAPIYDLIQARNVSSTHWHADETGWKVFEALKGKKNNRWFLWVFKGAETVLFKIAPSRSSQVLLDYFPADATGILNVDRYSAYKVIAKKGAFILAFCWAHVRRDFLDHGRAYPAQEAWALRWVNRIGELYTLNNERLTTPYRSKNFKRMDALLKSTINDFRKAAQAECADESLSPIAKKILISLERHWAGLTVFVDYPIVPMDNNKAENSLRGPVVARKGYYGSGAIWSSELAAILFSIFGTLNCWHINPHTWLLTYFQACARQGEAPSDIEKYLPWCMTASQREALSKPPPYENSS